VLNAYFSFLAKLDALGIPEGGVFNNNCDIEDFYRALNKEGTNLRID